MAERLGGIKGKLFLVGCEPRILDSEDGEMELSDEVRRGVPRALEMIGRLVNELLEKEATNAGAMPV
jgi:Ni,Fe-hydrogenase maturation factor